MIRRRRSWLAASAVTMVLLLVVGAGAYAVTNSRTWQVAGTIVTRVDTSEKVVAFTFDDGPSDAAVGEILQVLGDRGVRATFFLIGREIEANPEAAARIVQAGHVVASHAWSHQRMLLTPTAEVRSELDRTEAALRSAGWQGDVLFRPPYGKKLITLPMELARRRTTTVMWDVETQATTVDGVVADVSQHVRPGSIVLLHPWYGGTPDRQALASVIDRLRADGYRFVTVPDLIAMR